MDRYNVIIVDDNGEFIKEVESQRDTPAWLAFEYCRGYNDAEVKNPKGRHAKLVPVGIAIPGMSEKRG